MLSKQTRGLIFHTNRYLRNFQILTKGETSYSISQLTAATFLCAINILT